MFISFENVIILIALFCNVVSDFKVIFGQRSSGQDGGKMFCGKFFCSFVLYASFYYCFFVFTLMVRHIFVTWF